MSALSTQVIDTSRRPGARRAPRELHVVAATAFLVAWLSFAAFVALYRAPLPADAFAALGAQITCTEIGLARL